jgi:hypothetical protein
VIIVLERSVQNYFTAEDARECKIKNAKVKTGNLLLFHFAFYIFNFALFCVLCG